ncbi:hypothetical protein MD484_g9100, partial [Candolleomyces efflorescens]
MSTTLPLDFFAMYHETVAKIPEWKVGQPAVVPACPGRFLAAALPFVIHYNKPYFAPLRMYQAVQQLFSWTGYILAQTTVTLSPEYTTAAASEILDQLPAVLPPMLFLPASVPPTLALHNAHISSAASTSAPSAGGPPSSATPSTPDKINTTINDERDESDEREKPEDKPVDQCIDEEGHTASSRQSRASLAPSTLSTSSNPARPAAAPGSRMFGLGGHPTILRLPDTPPAATSSSKPAVKRPQVDTSPPVVVKQEKTGSNLPPKRQRVVAAEPSLRRSTRRQRSPSPVKKSATAQGKQKEVVSDSDASDNDVQEEGAEEDADEYRPASPAHSIPPFATLDTSEAIEINTEDVVDQVRSSSAEVKTKPKARKTSAKGKKAAAPKPAKAPAKGKKTTKDALPAKPTVEISTPSR